VRVGWGIVIGLLQAVRWAKSSFGLSRLYIQRLYGSDFVQLFVALLIVANFIANCLEAQFVGEFEDVFKMVETIFTSAFTTPHPQWPFGPPPPPRTVRV